MCIRDSAYTFPVTRVDGTDVENVFVASITNPNPVMKLAAAGLTPISPVIAVVPVVETDVFARITKSPAVLRFTPRPPDVAVAVVKLHTVLAASALPAKSFAPVVNVAV